MESLLVIDWNVNPEVIPGWNVPRWYGVMWALGFFLSYYILRKFLRKEGYPIQWVDTMLLYVLIGAVVGARAGHMFFYEDVLGPNGWLTNDPLEFFKIQNGGLASHGGAIGIIIAVILMNRKHHIPGLWTLDRLVIVTALTGFFIRMGNLFNHEIVGIPYDGFFAFEFDPDWSGPTQGDVVREYFADADIASVNWSQEQIDTFKACQAEGNNYGDAYCKVRTHCGPDFENCDVPSRHPAQLYEAIAYLSIFGVLLWLYLKTEMRKKAGRLLGAFLVLIFTARFFVEFIKVGQAERDAEMALNTGQMLSIPFVLIGMYLLFRPAKYAPGPEEFSDQKTAEKKK